LEPTYIDILNNFILQAIELSAIKVGDTLYHDQNWEKCLDTDVKHICCDENEECYKCTSQHLYTTPEDQEFIYKFSLPDGNNFDDIMSDKIFSTLCNVCENKSLKEIFDIVLFYTHCSTRIVNLSGYNEDHRGSDHYGINAKYDDQYDLPKGKITFGQWVKMLYTLKSHKTDSWYELYTSSTVEQIKHAIKVTFTFDHGS
jgi:hypothetical protein